MVHHLYLRCHLPGRFAYEGDLQAHHSGTPSEKGRTLATEKRGLKPEREAGADAQLFSTAPHAMYRGTSIFQSPKHPKNVTDRCKSRSSSLYQSTRVSPSQCSSSSSPLSPTSFPDHRTPSRPLNPVSSSSESESACSLRASHPSSSTATYTKRRTAEPWRKDARMRGQSTVFTVRWLAVWVSQWGYSGSRGVRIRVYIGVYFVWPPCRLLGETFACLCVSSLLRPHMFCKTDI